MKSCYDVMLDNVVVGQAQVACEGLYYHITCKCEFSCPDFYKIIIDTNNKKFDLGICVPDHKYYIIDRKIPCYKIEQGSWRFIVRMKMHDNFIAVFENMPLPDFAILPFARLAEIDNKKYIEFTD